MDEEPDGRRGGRRFFDRLEDKEHGESGAAGDNYVRNEQASLYDRLRERCNPFAMAFMADNLPESYQNPQMYGEIAQHVGAERNKANGNSARGRHARGSDRFDELADLVVQHFQKRADYLSAGRQGGSAGARTVEGSSEVYPADSEEEVKRGLESGFYFNLFGRNGITIGEKIRDRDYAGAEMLMDGLPGEAKKDAFYAGMALGLAYMMREAGAKNPESTGARMEEGPGTGPDMSVLMKRMEYALARCEYLAEAEAKP